MLTYLGSEFPRVYIFDIPARDLDTTRLYVIQPTVKKRYLVFMIFSVLMMIPIIYPGFVKSAGIV